MYKGSNPTALKSQQWIKESLYELLKEMPYEKINIKTITEKAGLARQTFYKSYASKDEIVVALLDEMFDNFKKSLLTKEKINLKTISFCYFEYFFQNKEIVYLLINNNLINLMEIKFCQYLNEVRLFISSKEKQHNQYVVSMVSGALLGILVQWFNNNLDLSIEELSTLVTDIFSGDLISD